MPSSSSSRQPQEHGTSQFGVQPLDPPSFKDPHPLYSSVTTARLSVDTSLVTVAGQVAEDPITGETPTGLASQIDLCLERMLACLEHTGAQKKDITRFMYYIAQRGFDQVDGEQGPGAALKLIGDKVGAWLEGHRPASCFLRVFGMSDDRFLCEFECMAIVENADEK